MKIKFLGIKFTFTNNWYKKPFIIAKQLYNFLALLLRIIFTFIKQIFATIHYIIVIYLKHRQLLSPPPYKLAICAIAKNEAPYIVEWIEFHKLIGVEKIYLYDNDSNDNLKEILKPYINSGFVEYTFFPGKKRQLPCYNYCFKKHKFDCEYIAVIDCDEFIVPVKYDTLTEFLNNFEKKLNKKPAAIGINWLMHGYNGYYNKQNGLVTEIYRKCDYNTNDNSPVKSIINPLCAADFISPHFAALVLGAKMLNSIGKPMKGPYNTPVSLDEIRVNHYRTKSYEEFMERIKKGKADGAIEYFHDPFYPTYYSLDDDSVIEKYLPLLKERVKNTTVTKPAI